MITTQLTPPIECECTLCPEGYKQKAKYYARMANGKWEYVCEAHYRAYGVGLGVGKGQYLRDTQ